MGLKIIASTPRFFLNQFHKGGILNFFQKIILNKKVHYLLLHQLNISTASTLDSIQRKRTFPPSPLHPEIDGITSFFHGHFGFIVDQQKKLQIEKAFHKFLDEHT